MVLIISGGCTKNTFNVTEREGVETKALVKIGLFNMYAVNTPVLIYNNGQRISSAITSPYPFPGGGFNTGGNSNGDYFAVNPGDNKFELFTTNAGTINLISKLLETVQNVEANKRYTIYIADTAANIVAVKAPDDAVKPDTAIARIRFINLIPNSPAGGLDFYKGSTLLKSGIKYKEFTEFFDIPASTVDTFSVRLAGSAAGSAVTAATYYRLATNTNQRIYSFVSRGYLGFPPFPVFPAVADLRRPLISVSVNQ